MKIKKLAEGAGTTSLYVGVGAFSILFNIVQFAVPAIAGLSMIWLAITLFLDGSVLWGILVLLIGTPLAIGVAGWAAPFLFFLGIIAAIIWGVIQLFGFNVSFGYVWDIIWSILTIVVLAIIAFTVTSSLSTAIFKGENNWFKAHLHWTFGLAYLVWFVLNQLGNVSLIAWWFSVVAAVIWLVISGWVIKEKQHSLWWILLSWIGSPLWLRRKSELTLQPDIRREDGISVLLVDDHKVVREGIQRMLLPEAFIEVVGEASNGLEAMDKIKTLLPDIVISNIKMPGMNGIELCGWINYNYPSCKVIILTLYDEYPSQALEAGAKGYLLKDIKANELVRAIKQVYGGQVVISDSITL